MADHDDEREASASDPAFAGNGPRRSTYTPPIGDESGSELHDDDELAQALADDLARIYTRPIPVVPPDLHLTAADEVESGEQDTRSPQSPPPGSSRSRPEAVVEPERESAPEPVAEPERESAPEREVEREAVAPPPFVVPSASDFEADAATAAPTAPRWQRPTPPVDAELEEPADVQVAPASPQSAPAPHLPAPPSTTEPPAWVMAPAPDPAHAVPLDSPPGPPVRRSLPDEELAHWVEGAALEPGSTLEVIEQLESQLQLREEEAHEFRSWENTMLALGTPEALAAVEEARPQFTGVLPELGRSSTQPPAAPGAQELDLPPEPERPSAEPAPSLAVDAEPEPAVVHSLEDEPEAEPEAQAAEASAPDTRADGVQRDVEAAAESETETTSEPESETELEFEAATPEPEAGAEVAEAESEAEAREIEAPETEFSSKDDLTWVDDAHETPGGLQVFEIPVVDASSREQAFEEIFPTGPLEPGEPFELLNPPSEAELQAGSAVEPEGAGSEPSAEAEPDTEPSADVESDTEPVADAEPDTQQESPPEAAPSPEPAGTPVAPPPLIEPPAPGDRVRSSEPVVFPLLSAEPGAPERPAVSPMSPSSFSFDDILQGDAPLDAEEEPLLRAEPVDEGEPERLFIEPLPVTAVDGIPTDTGTVRIIDRAYDEDSVDDAVDEIDRALPGTVESAAAVPVVLPSGPIATMRIPEHEVVIVDDEPTGPRAFSLETAGLEPTPVEQRAATSMRLFWIWFSANSSMLSLGLGAVVFTVGMSLRQSIVAVFAGVALSFLPLGLSTLAGKRSGQPTMVVSRATFGLLGNILPATIALLSRVFWGAVLLWLLGSAVVVVLVGAGLDGGLGDAVLLLIGLGSGLALATLAAFVGYGLLARIQFVLGVISAVLVVGLVALTVGRIDLDEALTNADGPWILTLAGAVLVFSFVGLVWAHSGADLARYQRADSSGAGSMLSSSFGATLPAFALIGYGALLAASDPSLASGFITAPIDTLAGLLPLWYPVPLLAATALSLLSGLIVTLYSGGLALQSLGVTLARRWSVLVVAVITAVFAALLAFGVGTLNEVFRDVATTLAVPTAAWVGIFAAELMIRNRRFEPQSLLKRGGVYPDVHWINTGALVVVSVIGFGFTTANLPWLSWQGYLFALFGVPQHSDLASTDLGVLVALGLGLIVPLALGVRTIRRQEAIEV